MKRNFILFLLTCSLMANLSGAEIEWSGSPNPIPNDGNLYYIIDDFEQTTDLTVNGVLEIRNGALALTSGDDALNINGRVYVYDEIRTGTNYTDPDIVVAAGEVNINHGGSMFLLGGKISQNPNTDPFPININAGGSLYNYHGTVDLVPDADLIVKPGGQFDNVRGNNPWPFTINTGGNFSDGNEINLDKNVDINWTWTLTNKATINGYGLAITFSYDGAIVIDKDASLLLEDVIINDVSGNQIRCIDTNSTLSINNVTWIQDADFTLTWGTIYVENNWDIEGYDTIFNYESDQPLTLAPDATISLNLTTLNYNTNQTNLVQLSDETSAIHLNDGTLIATQPWTLADGSLLVSGLGTLLGPTTLDLIGLADINVNGALRYNGDVRR